MDLTIREDVLKGAAQCQRDRCCIHQGKKEALCAVKQSVNGVLFVDYRHSVVCDCMLLFGIDYICTCPVRKEIYERYGS
jgi:hypothetical protein